MSGIHFPKTSEGAFREEDIFLFLLARDFVAVEHSAGST
jgi:hypothetical protein